MERQTTIKQIFYNEGRQFVIPSYQRAYSWEVDKDKKQVKQFVADIKEQNPKKEYFLGHFLFEKDEDKKNTYLVIDGQQRLTTVVIFFSCLIREFIKREKELGKIIDIDGNELETWRISENYIKYKNKYKFETVSYDNPYFQSVVFENNDAITLDTSSATRIKAAKNEFSKVIANAELSELLNWKNIIDDAVITTFEVANKLQASQIFAFQNDRGKELTTLEKLKAFLMHKIYAISENENPIDLIKTIETIFIDIYKQSERISYTEDQVLNFFNRAFLSGTEEPLKNVKSELQKIENKEKWIIELVINLKEAFINVEAIEKQAEQNCAIADVLILDDSSAMPLLIKLYHYHKADINLVNILARKIEHILFKKTYTTADYRTKNGLDSKTKEYTGDGNKLSDELQKLIDTGFQEWWNFTGSCRDYFNGNYHYNQNIKFVLWKYENYLREQNRTRLIPPTEYNNKFGRKNLDNTTDHITPQNPNFTIYTQEFRDNWLNNIGNLALMVWGDNAEKKNHNPIDKVSLFDSDFYTHKEIRDVLYSRKIWGESEIKERRDKITNFIFKNWELI